MAARGSVLVSGHAGIECDRVEARLKGYWVTVTLDRTAEHFRAEGPAAAGGFYRSKCGLLLQGEQVAEISVAHVGVDGVFAIRRAYSARQAMREEGEAVVGPIERRSGRD